MIKNCKKKGSRNEHKSKRLLEEMGYVVTRAGASLGVFDLIAIGAHDILLVQVKSNKWPLSVEMAAIREFVAPTNVQKIVHRWRDGQRQPDVRKI